MRPAALFSTVLVLVLASAAQAQTPPSDTADPSIRDGSAQRALTRARARWRASGLRDYRFTVTIQCFCPNAGEPRRVTVRDGRPERPPADIRSVATVKRLFRVVRLAIERKASGLSVRYGRRGVPVRISIDGRRSVADDEVSYDVSGFTPL